MKAVISAVLALLTMLTASAAMADTTYTFSGTCTTARCAAFPPAVRGYLTLTSDYHPGDVVTKDEFVSFVFYGSGHGFSIRGTNHPEFSIGGTLPLSQGVSAFGFGYTIPEQPYMSFMQFYSLSDGTWAGGLTHENTGTDPTRWNAGIEGRWTLTSAPPVPEPETYAMLLLGLGVVGALARRRHV